MTVKQTANSKSMQVRRGHEDPNKQSLNALIKESNNADAVKLKDEIDGIKKDRSKLISKVKDSRRRLSYKEAELTAIDRLLKMKKENDSPKRNRIGYLKHMKQRLEFKISTEASSLSQEKDIIRKINEINQELNEAFASVRLERKTGFVKKDIDDYRKGITDINAQIGELDTRLDGLYVNLRNVLGIGKWQSRPQQQRPRRMQPAPSQEINLEDIAVIKKKEK